MGDRPAPLGTIPLVPLLARIVLALAGLAFAVYAGASLTGHVTPPWWERPETNAEATERAAEELPRIGDFDTNEELIRAIGRSGVLHRHTRPIPAREAISIGVGAVGLALAGFAVLYRRRPEAGQVDPLAVRVEWLETGDPLSPYAATVNGERWALRINDFPDEPLWTLLVDGRAILDIDDFPAAWLRPRRSER
jgi:hypothetical protein